MRRESSIARHRCAATSARRSRVVFYKNLGAETAQLTERELTKIQQAGVELIEVDIPNHVNLLGQTAFPTALYEVVRDLRAYLNEYKTGLSLDELASEGTSPDVKEVFDLMLGEGLSLRRAISKPCWPDEHYRNSLPTI